jgi:hypothetical protein
MLYALSGRRCVQLANVGMGVAGDTGVYLDGWTGDGKLHCDMLPLTSHCDRPPPALRHVAPHEPL